MTTEEKLAELRTSISPCTEVWMDGSLSTSPPDWKQELINGERVSVLFSEGWYIGTVQLTVSMELQTKFICQHGRQPSFQIDFDDNTSHAYVII